MAYYELTSARFRQELTLARTQLSTASNLHGVGGLDNRRSATDYARTSRKKRGFWGRAEADGPTSLDDLGAQVNNQNLKNS